MPEQIAEATEVTETAAPKVGVETPSNGKVAVKEPAKVGHVQKAVFDFNAFEDNEALKATTQDEPETAVAPEANPKETTPTENKADTNAPSEINDEALKQYFEKNGIEFESIDKLKEKLKPQEVSTPEDIQRKKLAEEKRYVDVFVDGGGTVDQYVAIKDLANKPLKDLSLDTIKNEYKDLGFTEEEISDLVKERYYQLTDEEIETLDEEGQQYSKKLKDAFSKKLENKASYIQKQAKDILAGLHNHVEEEDLQVENEKVLSSKVDDIFKKTPRKITFEIGESNNAVIPPVDFEVSESDIDEVKTLLKDSEKRKQFLMNTDGSLNITNISNILLRDKLLQKAVKVAYLEATNRSAELVEQRYPSRSPFEVGVGGSEKSTFSKGQVAKVGKMQRV